MEYVLRPICLARGCLSKKPVDLGLCLEHYRQVLTLGEGSLELRHNLSDKRHNQ